MKKIIALTLAAVMALSLVACSDNGGDETTAGTTAGTTAPETTAPETTAPETTEGTTAPETTAPVVAEPSASTQILQNVWNAFGDEEKFAVYGGNMENPNWEGPGNYDMAYAENLTVQLVLPAEQLASVDEVGTMIHAMNANTFTSAVVHLLPGTDAAAFAAAWKDAVLGNQWMCGFPERLIIATVDAEHVVMAFGMNDAMNLFQPNFAEAYPEAEVLVDEAITG